MTSRSDSMEDLLVLSRRGELSEADERRLREALASSPETRLLAEAGRAFANEAPVEPGDEELLARVVRRYERQTAPRRRSAWRVALPAALAGAFGASLVFAAVQFYQARHVASPAHIAAPSATRAPEPAPVRGSPPSPALDEKPAPVLEAPAPPPGALKAPAAPVRRPGVAEPAAAPEAAAAAPTAAAAGNFPEQAAPQQAAPMDARALFAAGNAARVRGDRATASTLYRRLQAEFPESSEALASHVSLGMIALGNGDANTALSAFRAYRARGGGQTLAEALWGEAQALQRLGRSAEERQVLQELVQRYPSSAYVAAAQKRLSEMH